MRSESLRIRIVSILLAGSLISCGGGSGDPVVPDRDPPNAPTNVQVVSVGEGSVVLSWSSVTGATSYTIYHAAQSGVTKANYAGLADGGRVQNAVSPTEVTGLTLPGTHYFVVTASNADGESSESAPVSAMPEVALNPQGNTQLAGGDYDLVSVDIPAGVTVTVTGPVVFRVGGDAVIDGTIAGNCQSIELRVTGDFTLDGLLTNACVAPPAGAAPGLKVVADGAVTIGTAPSNDEAIVSDGQVRLTDTATENDDFEIVVDPEANSPSGPVLRGPARQAAPVPWNINLPVMAAEVRSSHAGDISVNANITANHGANAPAKIDAPLCDNTGATGDPGGDIYLFARGGTLTIGGGTQLQAGNGGKGGDCTATGDPAQALAGDGGRGGGVFLGGQGLTFGANSKIIRGNGGTGGRARADGDHATVPCEDGAVATATGGQGGRAGGTGYISEAAPVIQGAPMEDGGNGGKGGEGSARGGDGASCVCGMGDGSGGAGAEATATGGPGGDGARGSLFTIVPGSHKKGDGGDAEALGGFGGNGADCCTTGMPGGAGGNGGDATATGGAQSVPGMTDGTDGRAVTFGGNGGDGGDGNGPGAGGTGGVATSVGVPAEQNQGEDGADGEPCPPVTAMLDVTVTTSMDPAGHEPFTQIAATATQLTIAISGGVISVGGNGNWISVSGSVDGAGNFTATGSGSAAGFSGVSAEFTGTVTRDSMGAIVSVTGTYTVGGNGALPGGQPVVYSVMSEQAPPPVVIINLVDFSFEDPEGSSSTTISAGTTVRWVAMTGGHTVTPTGHSEWSGQNMNTPGDVFEHTFNTPGTFNYHCIPHQGLGMTGTIVVE